MQYLLSICIPTYNRGNLLEVLLQQLDYLLKKYDGDLQVCISDNYSDDNTESVIEKFAQKNKHHTLVVRQNENIGGSKNVIAVMRLSKARYILVLGDDDGLNIEGFDLLFKTIREQVEDCWILIGHIKNTSGINKSIKVHNFIDKTLNYKYALMQLIRHGTRHLGFIGCHVIPSSSLIDESNYKYHIQDFHGWPHIMLLYIHLYHKKSVRLINIETVIQSSQNQVALYWNPKDFFYVELLKNKMPMNKIIKRLSILNILLFFREIYSPVTIGFLISYRLSDKDSFNKESIIRYSRVMKESTSVRIIGSFYYIIISTLRYIPDQLIRLLLPSSILKQIDQLAWKANTSKKEYEGLFRKL